jgi:hypothetical protein
MTDNVIIAAGYAGLIGALLWRGLLPYLLERQRAEQNGLPPPKFSSTYMTTMIISTVAGFISVSMAIGEFEKSIASSTSIMTAAGVGFAFTYTVLGISNEMVDLRKEREQLKAELLKTKNGAEKVINAQDQPKT